VRPNRSKERPPIGGRSFLSAIPENRRFVRLVLRSLEDYRRARK
jgi:hypothetical protein